MPAQTVVSKSLAALVTLFLVCGAAGAAAPAGAGTDLAVQQTARTLSFKDLGMLYSLRLRTVHGEASIPLNLRADQIVTGATLDLHYAHSPSLRFDLSHLSVYVNDQVLRTLPLAADTASGTRVRIPIDPRLLLPHNQIRFELVAHYAAPNECEDPAHTTLWAEIGSDSTIELALAPLPTAPALERLPAPLFDAGDGRRLRLPFAFSGTPDAETVKAAGIVAAWFGAQADYRGADFPVSFGQLPPGLGVAFVGGGTPLPGLEAYAGRPVPTLTLVDNPQAPGSELLVVAAPNAAGLVQAAQALALGQVTLQGPQAQIAGLVLPPPREPWVSPRWIDPRRPFPLADGAIGPLSVTGLVPGPISFEFSLPPDFFPLAADSVRAHLKYRAAPVSATSSTLNVLLNGEFVGGVGLDRKAGAAAKVDASASLNLALPPAALGAHNRLDAQYHFRRDTHAACEDFDIGGLQGAIDPASTLELRHYANFTEMPALEKFADGAFPFSRLGDLAGTAVVLPAAPTESDVSAALIALGHIGRWTRDAASRVEVSSIDRLDTVRDRDLLLIGRLDRLSLPEDWVARLPLRLDANRIELAPIGRLAAATERYLRDRDVESAHDHASHVLVEAGQDFAALMGFESPLQAGRSVVLLSAGRGGDVRDAALAVTDPGTSQFVRGGLALVVGDKVTGYDFGGHYEVGRLPWWFALKRWFSLHPYLIWPLALLIAVILGMLARGVLARHARQRLEHKL